MVMDLPLRYGPSRRGREPNNNNNKSNNQAIVSCLVDGCNSDLSKGRDYHRRHKVCEIHSKTPKVTIRGQEQRFCQQCSRFHSLVEFDDVKRSCRKRLDGHNRRRRKPQPPESSSILLNSTAQFLSHFQGAAKYVETTSTGTGTGTGPGTPQVYPTASFSFGTDFFSRSHFDLGDKKAQSSSSSMPFSHSSFGWEQIQFPFFWQGGTTSQQEPFISEPPISSTAAPGMRMNGGGCNQELFLGSESSNDRALSLLSSLLPPPQTEASIPEEGRSRAMSSSQPTTQKMLVSDEEGDMFFQIRHDGSTSIHLHHHHHTPSAWEE